MQNKKIYVIGHRNPDADSVISAAAYAVFKQLQDCPGCVAARAGKLNPQTEYIFDRFNVPVPEFVPDLIPRVDYYMASNPDTVSEDTSLWEALALMEAHDRKIVPVVDSRGLYTAILHNTAFVRNMTRMVDPRNRPVVTTSPSLLAKTLNAQPVVVAGSPDDVRKCTVLTAAASFESFCSHLDEHLADHAIVIAGNRKDVQEYCVQAGVHALVVTNGDIIDKDIRAVAEKKGVTVLVSPYGTSATAMLIVYAGTVITAADTSIVPVHPGDTLRKIKPILVSSPARSLPVVNADNTVRGVISESDFMHEPNISVILVDHNEVTQAVEGIENYPVLEIIDHHRLGNMQSRDPITFINKPVGATCTLVTTQFRDSHIPIPRDIASILLAGILSDTINLQSATVTEIDKETVAYLASITGLDPAELGKDLMSAVANINGRSAVDVIHQDMKEYTEHAVSYSVSQIEVGNPQEVVVRKQEFLEQLEIERKSSNRLFCALMVTDITELTSLLFIAAKPGFESYLSFPNVEKSVYRLRDIVSRKKQLMPLLSEIVEKAVQ